MSDSSSAKDDPYRLERFVSAQDGIYAQALNELRAGRKRSHWMWFIFPQFAGLGFSSTSQHYAIKSREEARAYLQHPVLGPRLLECVQAVLNVTGRSASEIFGYPDDMKLKSSMTLFAEVSRSDGTAHGTPGATPFQRVLAKYYGGDADARTLSLMGP